MNKKLLCACSLLIVLQTHGFYGPPRVHFCGPRVVDFGDPRPYNRFYDPLKPDSDPDFMYPDYRKMDSKYDDVSLNNLEVRLTCESSKDLDSIDKQRIAYLIKKIKAEYPSIKDRWDGRSGSHNYPIKSIEWVSWCDIRTYLDTENVDHHRRIKALADRSADQ